MMWVGKSEKVVSRPVQQTKESTKEQRKGEKKVVVVAPFGHFWVVIVVVSMLRLQRLVFSFYIFL